MGDGYSRTGAAVHLMMIGFVFLWLPICSLIAASWKDGSKMLQTLTFWSKNVTCIYIIQWLLFGWSILILGMNQQTDVTAVFAGVIVLVASHFLTKSKKIRTLTAWI